MGNFIKSILAAFGYRLFRLKDKASGRMQYKLLKSAAWTAPQHGYTFSKLPAAVKAEIRANTMLPNLCLDNIIDTTAYIVQHKIAGDFVECGVWKGGGVALMSYMLGLHKEERHLQLFDAFGDICEPDAAVDGDRAIQEAGGAAFAQGRLAPLTGIYDNRGGGGNEGEVKDLITRKMGYPEPLVHLHKGWFQDTIPVVKDQLGKIAMLRLDGDWYASTKVCLDNLYDKVVDKGVIIIDDYGAYEGCRKAVDEFLANRGIKARITWVNQDCVFWIKNR